VSVSSSQHTIKEKQLDPLHCSRAHLFPLQKWPHVSNLLPTPSSAIIMTSFSLTFTSPLLPSSSTKPKRSVLVAAAQTTAPAESTASVDADRLEPRVELKDGFFILKEKFRKGINPQEKVKIEREPMKLFMENGIEELAKKSMEELDSEKSSKDDIDVRLKWLGLFHRRKHQCMFLLSILFH